MASIINALSSGAGGLVTSGDTSGVLQLQNNSSASVTLDASGNVGIGTTSPTNFGSNFKMLAVQGSDFGVIQAISNSGSTTVEMMGASGTGYVGTRTNHPLAFRTYDTERMRIDSSGNLLVGTTTSIGSGKFVTSFSSNSGPGLIVSDSTIQNTATFLGCYAGSTRIGSITANGTTNVAFNTSSDYRLKENIAPIENALERIAQLNPVTYTWKNTDNELGEGFIAHELAEVCPLAVTGEKDAVEEDGSIKAQGVDYSKLTALLTKAIQEMKAIIDAQSARIDALENK